MSMNNIFDGEELPRLDEQSLKQLAEDWVQGKIFSSAQLPPGEKDVLRQVFTPLMYLNVAQLHRITAPDVGIIFEYMDKKGLGRVYGFPQFFSIRLLHTEDFEFIKKILHEVRDELQKFNNKEPDENQTPPAN